MLLILLGIIFLIDSFGLIIKTKKSLLKSGDKLDIYKNNQFHISINIIGMLIISLCIYFISRYLSVLDVLVVSVWGCIIYIKLIRNLMNVGIYENGIYIKGRFLEWNKLNSYEVTNKNRIIVRSDYLSKGKIKSPRISSEISTKYVDQFISTNEVLKKTNDQLETDSPFLDWIIEIIYKFKK